jgi:hypothetical protein
MATAEFGHAKSHQVNKRVSELKQTTLKILLEARSNCTRLLT